MGRWKQTFADRFWSKCAAQPETGCLVWTSATDGKRGYGHFNVNGKPKKAHRIAYELHHGVPPDGWVLHHCDNPPCVNPEHLYVGTHADNMRDRRERGRVRYGIRPIGSAHHKARLTEADIPVIRTLYRWGAQAPKVAKAYRVSTGAISAIFHGRHWRHVP
jgi:HNH endonuclease